MKEGKMEIFLSLVKTPAVIIAIIAFLGLVFQKASVSRVITGTALSFIGFTMIKVGGSILMKAVSYTHLTLPTKA